jgi:cell division protein FtsQ
VSSRGPTTTSRHHGAAPPSDRTGAKSEKTRSQPGRSSGDGTAPRQTAGRVSTAVRLTGRGSGGIDPRISARRTAVIRQQGRRRLRILLTGVLCVVAAVAAWYALHSPLFSARSVTVVGAVHETPAQVKAASGLSSHTPLMDVDRGAVSARIEQLPWVRSAVVAVSWPDGVRITLTEETPRVAVPEPGARWATVSADGRVLQVTAARPAGLRSLSVPQAPGAPGSLLPTRDRVGLLVAGTLPASFAAQVTGVTVEPAGWVQLAMTTPIVVNIGSATQLEAKYEDVSSILAGASLQSGDVIDVSVPRAPTVTPGGASG